MNSCDTYKTDSRVSQLAFHERFDFFTQGFPNSPAMMLQPAFFQDSTSGKTVENIRKMGLRVALSRANDGLLCIGFAEFW
jgi:hypothetical protein